MTNIPTKAQRLKKKKQWNQQKQASSPFSSSFT
jgi:hypothetical protein